MALEQYFSFMDKLGEAIIEWSDPESAFRANRDDWWLCDFRSAGTIALTYVAFVVVGKQVMQFLSPIDPYPIKFIYNVSHKIKNEKFCFPNLNQTASPISHTSPFAFVHVH